MTLEELLGRIERASEPDRLLETELALIAGYRKTGPSTNYREHGEDERGIIWRAPDSDLIGIPHFTESVDAALGLVDRIFGTNSHTLCHSFDLGWHCYAHAHMAYTADLHLAIGDPAEITTTHGQARTLPLAILAAILRGTALDELRKPVDEARE